MSIKFTIDQGHGKNYNAGAVSGYYEGNAMFELGGYLKEELEKYNGFSAVLTRSTVSDDPVLKARGNTAISNGSQVFVSLHSNASVYQDGSINPNSCGTEIFRSIKLPASEELATILGKSIADLINTDTKVTNYRGTKTYLYPGTTNTDYFAVMRESIGGNVQYSFLIEHAFHTNYAECGWLNDKTNLRQIAKVIAEQFAIYFGAKEYDNTNVDSLTPIMGSSIASAGQCAALLLAKNPEAQVYAEYAKIFMEEAEIEGVRGDIAFAQSCLETGYFKFGGDVAVDQNNYCGLGATGGGVPGHSFDTVREGIRAQIQHLKAYACSEPLVNACVDPRFNYVTRESSPYVEWLGIQDNPQGLGWAVGAGYGECILRILDSILEIDVDCSQPDDMGIEEPAKPDTDSIKPGDHVYITGDLFSNGVKVHDWALKVPHSVTLIDGNEALLGYPAGIRSRVLLRDLRKA